MIGRRAENHLSHLTASTAACSFYPWNRPGPSWGCLRVFYYLSPRFGCFAASGSAKSRNIHENRISHPGPILRGFPPLPISFPHPTHPKPSWGFPGLSESVLALHLISGALAALFSPRRIGVFIFGVFFRVDGLGVGDDSSSSRARMSEYAIFVPLYYIFLPFRLFRDFYVVCMPQV